MTDREALLERRAARRRLEWADRELAEMRSVLTELGEATDLAIDGLRDEIAAAEKPEL